MQLFLSCDADDAGRMVGRARLADDVEEVRRVDQVLTAGNNLWQRFVLANMGEWIEGGGDEVCFSIPATHLDKVPAIKEQYENLVGRTLSIGVGIKLSESAKALLVAKLTGKNKILFWNPSMEAEIKAAQDPEKQTPGQRKEVDAYLGKAGDAAGQPESSSPPPQDEEHSSAKDVYDVMNEDQPPPPEMTHAGADWEKHCHSLAQNQEETDKKDASSKAKDHTELKQRIVQTLQAVKQQTPILAQLKQTAPDTYQSIMRLVQGVIDMARELGGTDPSVGVHKSEDWFDVPSLQKMAIRDLPAGVPGPPPNRRAKYDYSHLLSPVLRATGHRVFAFGSGGDEPMVSIRHNGATIGTVIGEFYKGKTKNIIKGKVKNTITPHSELAPEYRGLGLGKAAYSALYRHALGFGINRVVGGVHTPEASRVHQSLANEHGFEYIPVPVIGHPNLVGDYSYYTDSDLNKMAFSDVPIGPRTGTPGQESFDYSHLLPKHLSARGYNLTVHHGDDVPTDGGDVYVIARHGGHQDRHEVGHISGGISNAAVHPGMAEVDEEHRGQDIGTAMYEALISHAYNYLNAPYTSGGKHSTSAHKCHEKIKVKHNTDYVAKRLHHGPAKDYDAAYGPYHYGQKSKPTKGAPAKGLEKDDVPMALKPPKPPKPPKKIKSDLDLLPGSEHDGKILVEHLDHSRSWRSVRAGKGLSPDPSHHVASSREPGAK